MDSKVRASAMQSKIVDASAYAKRLRQEKNTCRQRVLKKYRLNKAKGKRIVDGMLVKYREKRLQEYTDADKKVQFYREKSLRDKSMKEVPEETSQFLKGVNIFTNDQKIEPQPPLGPFICSEKIKLNANELKILSRGPRGF